jgi:hypothetical protein
MNIEIYNINREKYITELFEKKYVFEITKCCNYFVWISIYKSFSLQQLYENVTTHFEITNEPINLIVVNTNNNEKLNIPNDNTKIKEFIKQNTKFFCPLYPLPSNIVYKIYLDYGYCYNDNCKIHK